MVCRIAFDDECSLCFRYDFDRNVVIFGVENISSSRAELQG